MKNIKPRSAIESFPELLYVMLVPGCVNILMNPELTLITTILSSNFTNSEAFKVGFYLNLKESHFNIQKCSFQLIYSALSVTHVKIRRNAEKKTKTICTLLGNLLFCMTIDPISVQNTEKKSCAWPRRCSRKIGPRTSDTQQKPAVVFATQAAQLLFGLTCLLITNNEKSMRPRWRLLPQQ